jgi:Uma2 family endonuclease
MNAAFTPQRTLIDVEQFQRMGEAGIFPPDARIELIEGELLNMAPIGNPHAWAVDSLTRLLLRSDAAESFHLSVQNPVILLPRSMPQPDLMILRPPRDRYRTHTAVAADVLVLIEVSESTLRFDRTVKVPLYARHGVGEVWIVNLPERQLEISRGPADGRYAETSILKPQERATTPAVPTLELAWSEALAPDA